MAPTSTPASSASSNQPMAPTSTTASSNQPTAPTSTPASSASSNQPMAPTSTPASSSQPAATPATPVSNQPTIPPLSPVLSNLSLLELTNAESPSAAQSWLSPPTQHSTPGPECEDKSMEDSEAGKSYSLLVSITYPAKYFQAYCF